MQIVDLPEVGGYFKPADFEDADALLIEVLQFEPNRPDDMKGLVDVVHANVTVFYAGQEPVTHPRVQINHNGLTRKLRSIVGNGTVQRLGKAKTKKGHDAWVWETPSAEAKTRALEFAKALEDAAADAPDFDDD